MYVRTYTLFSTFHPGVLFFYALGAPVLSMLSHEPGYLLAGFVMAVVCHGFYYGIYATLKSVACMSPFLLLIAVLNMLSNPRGETILFTVGHRIYTWESLWYGLGSAAMLASVLLWFRCFTVIIDNQKFSYLFGRKFPALALLLSMILKLFPGTEYKIGCIKNAQKQPAGSRKEKLLSAMRQISCLLEWSMEDSIETAESMKARGYGNGTRGQYERYGYAGGDAAMTGIMLLTSAVSVTGITAYPDKWTGLVFASVFWGLPVWMECGGRLRHIMRETKMSRRK